jgi:serine/threonine-protein kinase
VGLVSGEIIDGKYRVVRLLGQGGMGSVYQGENVRIGRPVAIKVMHASLAREADLVERFEREAKAAGRIGSSHIVDVLDLGELRTRERYMVMEFLDGESLATRLKKRKCLLPAETAAILVQLLEGLAKVHDAGILHRDLKPGNVFLVRAANGTDFVKLLDFGICKFVESVKKVEATTDVGSLLGTPAYMAPEALEDAMGKLDARSDLYSAGVLFYRCVTGKLPYPASNILEMVQSLRAGPIPIRKAAPKIDGGLAALIDKATARRPAHRFQSAAQFRDAIMSWAKGQDRLDRLLTEFLEVPATERPAIPSDAPRSVKTIFTPSQPTMPSDLASTTRRRKVVRRAEHADEITAKRQPVKTPVQPMRPPAQSMSIEVEFDDDDDEVTLRSTRQPNPNPKPRR